MTNKERKKILLKRDKASHVMITKNSIYSLLLLGTVALPTNAQAGILSGEYSVALGVGDRPLDGLEAGVEGYIIEQGYNKVFPDITDKINFEKYSMVYLTGELAFSPQFHILKKDRLDVIFAIDATGFSKEGEEKLTFAYPIDDDFEVKLGDYKTHWEVHSPLYMSLGPEIAYAPTTFQKGRYSVAPGFAVSGGEGYITKSTIDVASRYETNEIMDVLVFLFGEDVIDDLGIVREQEVHITMKGKGPFVSPKGRVTFGYWHGSIVVQGGPRFERIDMRIVEQIDSERTIRRTQFDLDGFAWEVLLRYDF